MQYIQSFKTLTFSILSFILISFNTGVGSENISQNDILVGELNIEELEKFKWYHKNYDSYKPKEKIVNVIAKNLENQNITIEVYFGTWCSDSQYEVPSLIKLLHYSDFKMNRLKLIGVPRNKKVPNVSPEQAEKLNVKMVPTIIFYKDGKELNRFVEFAQVDLETDVLSILKDEGYEHSYKF